ncbi:alpha/beta hydrolase [Streptomyces sp. NPDC002055]|uniref:alpha/beta hydrolase n=1 Tax=Streptomyces sp. NPDC002055 TaxID=3154534 RepID=UPI00333246AC
MPLDYRRPGGKTIELAVSRMKARDADKRRGALLMNPGGPGDSGRFMPLTMELPDSVRDRFDLIGFDPRGMWGSAPVHCGLTEAEDKQRHPYDPQTFAKNVAWARTVAEKCRTKHGARLPHITTRNTARDMDVIRSVLGEKRISYFGASYGTYLGAVYTQMFPNRADRFILDSAVDPNRVWREYNRREAPHAERAFRRWSAWTARRDAAYHLGDTPAKVRKTFWALVAQADRTPIEDGGQTYTGADIRNFAGFSIVREAAGNIVRWKKAADDTTPTTPPPATDSPAPANDSSAGYWTVECGDAAWPRDPEQYRRDAARDKVRYPLVGDLTAGITPCAFWAKGSEPRTVVGNDTPALILQNEWDDSTPLAGARGLRKAMKGARMVTVAGGEGHGVYANPHPPCVERAVTAYLTTGRLPTGDVTCRASDTPPQPTADHGDEHAE